MTFAARILADSMSPDGVRLTTFEVTHPRSVLAELNTHRALSKNSGSSRAVPVVTMLQRLRENPYVPIYWGANQKGMQADEELSDDNKALCLEEWLSARDSAMRHADRLRELGLHKQDANRILEPFMWHTGIVSGTEFDNLWHLRDHKAAHPGFRTFVAMMRELHRKNEPDPLNYGDWHMPLIGMEDYNVDLAPDSKALADLLSEVSVGRCARVTVDKHDAKRDISEDIKKADELRTNGHMSPFEHVARPAEKNDSTIALVRLRDMEVDGRRFVVSPPNQWHGNFRGWVQKRKLIANEHDIFGGQQQ